MKLRFKSSQEFRDYSKEISTHIKNTSLRPLRLAMSNVDGYSSVQAYCLALDSNKNTDSQSDNNLLNIMRVHDGIISFNADISLDKNIKYSGIEKWNDYIGSMLIGGYVLSDSNAEYKCGDIFSCSGYIELADFDVDSIYDFVHHFLSLSSNSNYHIVTNELMDIAEKYIFNYLDNGGDLYSNMADEMSPDQLSDISVNISDALLIKTIPSLLLSGVEKDVQFECAKNIDLSVDIIKGIALKDITERLVTVTINSLVLELLSSVSLDSITGKRWETLMVSDNNLLEKVRDNIRMPLMKKIAFSQI